MSLKRGATGEAERRPPSRREAESEAEVKPGKGVASVLPDSGYPAH